MTTHQNSENLQPRLIKNTHWTDRELKRFFAKSRRVYQSAVLDIKIAPQLHTQGHLLIVTPKKVGNAPQRNQFKRRIKAIFYENNLGQCGIDWGIFAKPGITQLTFAELKNILMGLCPKQS